MTSFAKRLATALLLTLGGAGTMGCELIATVDRSKIPGEDGGPGAGGQGGGTTTSTGGQGGAGGSVPMCGDGAVDTGEACDDGNAKGGDGCDDACKVEPGYGCTGAPSVCTTTCGDGTQAGKETCDDGNMAAGDGCDATCQEELGYTCMGIPSACDPTCGDGIVVGAETCDDKNTMAGDGCDGSCAAEPGFTCMGSPSMCMTTCGDGVVAGAEACDDGGTAANDGCGATCTIDAGYTCMGSPSVCVTTCGDGTKAGAEACDDSNKADLDGCSSTCHVDSFTEAEPNDTTATANGPFTPAPGVILHGAIKPGTDPDVYAIVVPATADLHIESYDAGGPSGCANIDTVVTLIGTDGTTVLAVDDDSGVSSCSRIDAKGYAAAAHVPAGTYYVKVEAFNGFKPIPGYTLVVTFDALCGDAKVAGHEQCDGGAGCTATCDHTLVCGDGFVVGPEACDDGNTMSGDGCSATCAYEILAETEPNDTFATASGPFTPNKLLGGSITPAADVDYFAIMLPATADLGLETFDAGGPKTCANIDTVLTLFGTDGTTVLLKRDQGGVSDCSKIDPALAADAKARHLPAGTYFARVEDYQNNNAIPGYTLLVTYAALCGNSVVEGAEECDGGAGCAATCDRVPLCGDGLLDAPEACDDGNVKSGDGCDSACQVETVAEIEPNDDFATANGPYTPYVLLSGAISPGDDVDFFKLVLTNTMDLTIETFDGSGPGSCVGMDSVVTLLAADGTTELTSADDGGVATCSKISSADDPGARHLAPGTYYVKVEDFGNNTIIPAYLLQISPDAICGNNVAEGSEECDGGAKCAATCDRLPQCGDGFVDAPETCDDGNTTAGDGCGATCGIESVAELEPNDDLGGADAAAAAMPSVQIAGSTYITGDINPPTDEDIFKIVLAAPAVVRLETFDGSAVDCPDATTFLSLYDGAGAMLLNSDDNSGIGSCAALVLPLAAGTYYLDVSEETGGGTLAAYVLQAAFEGSAGAEMEPNDTSGAATVVVGSEVFVGGDHAGNTDTDYFKITVPAGKSVRAEVIEGAAETCESFDIDSFLTLYDAAGVALGGDDDSGRGFCSLIDGTGAAPADGYAHGLAGGAYYLAVEAAPQAQGVADTSGQFAYKLAITLR